MACSQSTLWTIGLSFPYLNIHPCCFSASFNTSSHLPYSPSFCLTNTPHPQFLFHLIASNKNLTPLATFNLASIFYLDTLSLSFQLLHLIQLVHLIQYIQRLSTLFNTSNHSPYQPSVRPFATLSEIPLHLPHFSYSLSPPFLLVRI